MIKTNQHSKHSIAVPYMVMLSSLKKVLSRTLACENERESIKADHEEATKFIHNLRLLVDDKTKTTCDVIDLIQKAELFILNGSR